MKIPFFKSSPKNPIKEVKEVNITDIASSIKTFLKKSNEFLEWLLGGFYSKSNKTGHISLLFDDLKGKMLRGLKEHMESKELAYLSQSEREKMYRTLGEEIVKKLKRLELVFVRGVIRKESKFITKIADDLNKFEKTKVGINNLIEDYSQIKSQSDEMKKFFSRLSRFGFKKLRFFFAENEILRKIYRDSIRFAVFKKYLIDAPEPKIKNLVS